jgi:hypothetical protein
MGMRLAMERLAMCVGRAGTAEGSQMDVVLKRAYEPAAESDGYRVLIDRMWPRGCDEGPGPSG